MKQLSKLCTLVICTIMTLALNAQTFDQFAVADSSAHFDFLYRRANFSGDVDQSFLSGSFMMRYSRPVSDKMNLMGSVNYTRLSAQGDSESGFGNVYLGAQLKLNSDDKQNQSLDFGVYLPTGSDEGGIGIFYDHQNFNSYTPLDFAVNALYRHHIYVNSDFRVGLHLGLDLSAIEDSVDDIELFARYGLSLMYDLGDIYLMTEFLNLSIITEDDSFGDNSLHSLAFGLGYQGEVVSPFLSFKAYLDDDLGDFVDGIITIGINSRF